MVMSDRSLALAIRISIESSASLKYLREPRAELLR